MPYLGEAVRVITIAAMTALFAVVMGWLPLTPLMADHDTQDLKRQSRFERAAQQMCGPGATWTDLGNSTVQCFQHTGRKAAKVAIK